MSLVNIREAYISFCQKKNIDYQDNSKLLSYDDTTLFCPAGMQQFKKDFSNKEIKDLTKANIQSCLRLVDIDNIGDGAHFLHFNMMGLFSFRSMSVYDAIKFWMEFLKSIGIRPDFVTIHPDKLEWKDLYKDYGLEIREDKDCVWSDGEISGFCTEFYKDNIEIGNIVNICDDCIDVGFGLERLNMVVNGKDPEWIYPTDTDILKSAIAKILADGIVPSNKQHGYVLRKLMRLLYKKGGAIDSSFFDEEKIRQEAIISKYSRLKNKFHDKPKEWWFDTHGIDLDLMD